MRNKSDPRTRGFSLVEMMIIVVIIGVMIAMGGMAISSWELSQRAKDAARDMADIVMLARGEAIRTGVQHLVFFNTDPLGAALAAPDGTPVAALLARDDNSNGSPDAGEYVTSVPLDSTASVSWGVTTATLPAPGDTISAAGSPPASPWAFQEPGGGAANWIAYFPDGTPRSFGIGPFTEGGIGSGDGAVYVTSSWDNGASDYAVVLAALGGIRVHAWDAAATPPAWRQ